MNEKNEKIYINCIAHCRPFQREKNNINTYSEILYYVLIIINTQFIHFQHCILKRINMSMLCKCLVKKLGCNENTFIAKRENINKTVITIAYS